MDFAFQIDTQLVHNEMSLLTDANHKFTSLKIFDVTLILRLYFVKIFWKIN